MDNANALYKAFKAIALFLALFLFVLIVNNSIISFDMIYPEQPILYIVNSAIHSLQDFLDIYTHPKMLDIFCVPFFRPSGHFLMYQIFAGLIGWHNTKGLIIINLAFLALSGLMMIKLYNRLFPNYKVGGYIAFSIYLMHPALILSRIIAMHFEFAYIFFSLLSVYCFVRFCQSGYQRSGFFIVSLLCYIFGVTFKEPAIMVGAVLLCYFSISLYEPGYPLSLLSSLFYNRRRAQIAAVIIVTSITLGLYLTLQWPSLFHPLRYSISNQPKIPAIIELLKNIPGMPYNFSTRGELESSALVWRDSVFPLVSRCILYFLLSLSMACMLLVYANKNTPLVYKKSLLFLFITSLLFLILPINWAMGLPWHLSPTLVFLSLIMGFSCEYLCHLVMAKRIWVVATCASLAMLIGFTTLNVNNANIKLLIDNQGLAITLLHSALTHPPLISEQLNPDSTIVIEDSRVRNNYALGSRFGASLLVGNLDFDYLSRMQSFSLIKLESIYDGTIFRWAYLMPSLDEQIVPFRVDEMQTVSDFLIYTWSQRENNIFCLGYNEKGEWQDKTALFKKNLNIEKRRRQIIANAYTVISTARLQGNVIESEALALPDVQLCQFHCDQNKLCGGFTYIDTIVNLRRIVGCSFYGLATTTETRFCPVCTGYIKSS